jgi:hypothetical protein
MVSDGYLNCSKNSLSLDQAKVILDEIHHWEILEEIPRWRHVKTEEEVALVVIERS